MSHTVLFSGSRSAASVARLLVVAVAACFLALTVTPTMGQEDADEFTPLFNGQDLEGWVVVNTAPSTWHFEDGLLICSGRPIGEIRTERMYQNFILEVEWRHMVPRGNAGIFIWADDITAKGQPFHRGIEVQVLENAYGNTRGYTTHGDIFPIHGARMTPVNGRGGSRAFPTEERSNPSPEWNHYRIEARDGRVTLAVNGKVVTEGLECSPSKGYICLESEGGVVHYRGARIKVLPDSPVDEQDIAIANRGYRCLYNGIDLDGWKAPTADGETWQPRNWVLHHAASNDGSSDWLESDESFASGGFLIDFKWLPETQQVVLEPHGSAATRLTFDPADESLKDKLATDGWNRIDGTLLDGRLNVSINDQPWIVERNVGDIEAGPWRLTSQGPVDFANPFVRGSESVTER